MPTVRPHHAAAAAPVAHAAHAQPGHRETPRHVAPVRKPAQLNSTPRATPEGYARLPRAATSRAQATAAPAHVGKILTVTTADGETASLRPVSKAFIEQFVREVKSLRVQDLDGKYVPVPWAWLPGNNCLGRSLAIAYALNRGGKVRTIPNELSDAQVASILNQPKVDLLRIELLGGAAGSQEYLLPDGRKLPLTTEYSWGNHRAVVLNMEGTLMVLDLALSDKPLTIEGWAQNFFKKLPDTGLPLVNREEAWRLSAHLQHLPTDKKPKALKSVMLTPAFTNGGEGAVAGGEVRYDVCALGNSFSADLNQAQGLFEDEGVKLSYAQIASLRVLNKIEKY